MIKSEMKWSKKVISLISFLEPTNQDAKIM